MKPEEFINIWDDPNFDLIKVPSKELERFKNLSLDTREFLTIAGLPSTYGELNFDYLYERVQTVNEMWDLDEAYFDNFICIGFNGSGDPIAINLNKNDSLIYFNHDNNFEEIFINSNVNLFAETIIRMDKFYLSRYKLDSNSDYRTEFNDLEFENLKSDLLQIDRDIFDNEIGSHWKFQLDYFLWERDDERNKYGK